MVNIRFSKWKEPSKEKVKNLEKIDKWISENPDVIDACEYSLDHARGDDFIVDLKPPYNWGGSQSKIYYSVSELMKDLRKRNFETR